MDVYSRYPNRKKPLAEMPSLGFNARESEPQSASDNSPGADGQAPGSEKTKAETLPLSGYKIIAPKPEPEPESLFDKSVEAETQPSSTVIAAAREKIATGKPPAPRPSSLAPWIERMRNFAQSQTRLYAAAGVGLGVLLGVVIAAIFWLTANPGPYDLGSSASEATGLKGHLYTEWDKKPQYRLTIEPGDSNRLAGFALTVAHSPRPLSVEIRLLDAHGFVLCAREIALKYDPRSAEPLAASDPGSQAAQANARNASGERLARELEETRQESQEAEREQGKDIFQNQIGADGQIAALYAEGEIPCSQKAYGKAISWSFLPNFPTLAEQDQMLNRQKEQQERAARRAAAQLDARSKKAPKPARRLLPFSVEGDDAIVEFDPSRGVIETRGEKTFFFDKSGGRGADSRWQDYPVSIHYRCDRASNCVLTHSGLGDLRAAMRR